MITHNYSTTCIDSNQPIVCMALTDGSRAFLCGHNFYVDWLANLYNWSEMSEAEIAHPIIQMHFKVAPFIQLELTIESD